MTRTRKELEQQAKELNLIFNGFMEDTALFTDCKTESTFAVREGTPIVVALEKHRNDWLRDGGKFVS
jgi:hypothetical protein